MKRDIRIPLSLRMPTANAPASVAIGDRTNDGWVLVSVSDDLNAEQQEVLDGFGMLEVTLCDTTSHAAAICRAIERLDLEDVTTAYAQLYDGDAAVLARFPDGESEIVFHDGREANVALDDNERILRSWDMAAAAFQDTDTQRYAIGDRLTQTVMSIMTTADNLDAVKDVQEKLQAIPGADVTVISTSVDDHEDDMARIGTAEEYAVAHAAVRKVAGEIGLDSAKALVSDRVLDELRDAAPDLFPEPDANGPEM
jgi:hypothetical protein